MRLSRRPGGRQGAAVFHVLRPASGPPQQRTVRDPSPSAPPRTALCRWPCRPCIPPPGRTGAPPHQRPLCAVTGPRPSLPPPAAPGAGGPQRAHPRKAQKTKKRTAAFFARQSAIFIERERCVLFGKTVFKCVQLGAQLGGHVVADLVIELFDALGVLEPQVLVDVQQVLDSVQGDAVQTGDVDVLGAGADSRSGSRPRRPRPCSA